MAFADFFDKCDFRTAVGNTLRSVQLNQQDIYTYFQQQMNPGKWNNDFFNGQNGQEGAGNSHPLVELTASNYFVETDIAYNFFCKGAPSPLLLLNVIEYENQAAFENNNGTPGYLHTNVYKLNSSEPVTTFEHCHTTEYAEIPYHDPKSGVTCITHQSGRVTSTSERDLNSIWNGIITSFFEQSI